MLARSAIRPFSAALPRGWERFFDETVTAYVKEAYSPRPAWKGKPFSLQDARFFAPSVAELSRRFVGTSEMAKGGGGYFAHPRFRSAYLLYFLPLQAAKFATLFSRHPGFSAADELSVIDLGCGPATASLALIAWLADRPRAPRLRLVCIDANRPVLDDARALLARAREAWPKVELEVEFLPGPWWSVMRGARGARHDLLIAGNLLNEAPPRDSASLLDLASSALFVEPATRRNSRLLASLRADWLARGVDSALTGPCLHSGECPLAQGRDWCHFSFPVEIPGRWFREHSRAVGSPREWVKLCYLWVGGALPARDPRERLVVSDPMGDEVLVCEPGRPGRQRARARRGEIIRLAADAPRSRRPASRGPAR